MKPINIIYIYGRGHIGSTLLDRLLGCDQRYQSLGEIMNLKQYAKKEAYLCSCGKNVLECDFWSKVLVQYSDLCKKEKIKNPYNLSVGSLKKKTLWLLTSDLKIKNNPEVDEYNKKNYLLFKTIKEVSGKETIIDSSKNPIRLTYLANSERFNIKVIYLFRDGRGTLYSRKKAAKNNASVPYRGAAFETIRFVWHEKVLRTVLKKLDLDKKVGIRYETLAGKFPVSIRDLYDKLDIEYQEEVFEKEDSEQYFKKTINDIERTHLIGGNRMRYRKIEGIKASESWRKGLSKKEMKLFRLFGGTHQNTINCEVFKE